MASDTATILIREGDDGHGYRWRQYLVIRDASVAIVYMAPAMFGWNIDRVFVQGANDWPGMTRDQIVAWKLDHDDERTARVPADEPFRARLLAVTAGVAVSEGR